MAYRIKGVEVPMPRSFNMVPLYIEKRGRVASGKAVMDRVGVKRVFNLSYTWIKGDDLNIFLNAIQNDGFFNFTFENEAGSEQTVEVMAQRETPTRRWTLAGNDNYYSDVEIGLIER